MVRCIAIGRLRTSRFRGDGGAMSMSRPLRKTVGVATVVVALAAAAAMLCFADATAAQVGSKVPAFPTDGPFAYRVEYLGVTCGLMTLESRLEEFEGRPSYHVTMTARNSKFFNKIYRLDGRIDSWVDAETMSTIAYESDITGRGDRDIKRYRIDRDRGVATAEKNGKLKEVAFAGGPALDPMAFVYRSRVLAEGRGSMFSVRVLTDRGVVDAVSQVGETKRFSTYDGERELLRVQPITADGEMFSHRGEFVLWIDPGPARTLHRLDFKLGFGRLKAELIGPADGHVDRRADPGQED
jgi:hypothetical protein